MSSKDTSSSPGIPRVVVFGASGHTGRFVVAELARRGIDTILAGRDAEKLLDLKKAHPAFETRVASVDDPALMQRALEGASLVINCAGPFVDTAAPTMEAAIRARIHYLDVTAEQRVTLAAFEKFSAPARTAGILIMPSVAFYGALADMLATVAMRNWLWADEIRIAVALDSWKPTRGTRLTGQKNSGPRLVFSNNSLLPLEDPPPKLQWTFAPPFGKQEMTTLPLAETIVISRHLHVREIRAYINLAPLADLHNPHTAGPIPADETGRSAQQFSVEVRVRRGGEERRATAAGRDIYAITAPIVVEAATRILAGGVPATGTAAPGQIFDAETFLQALSPEHISLGR